MRSVQGLQLKHRAELERRGLPIHIIDRLDDLVFETSDHVALNDPSLRVRARKLDEIAATLEAAVSAIESTDTQTKLALSAHSFAALKEEAFRRKTVPISFAEFEAVLRAIRDGAVAASHSAKAQAPSRGKEPRLERQVAVSIARLFRACNIGIDRSDKGTLSVAIALCFEALGMDIKDPGNYAKYACDTIGIQIAGDRD